MHLPPFDAGARMLAARINDSYFKHHSAAAS
jgi:hypothetical protein